MKTSHSLALAIRHILTVGIGATTLLAAPALAQTAPTTANDAVKAAADAARAAADAARAAAEAARVAAEAARAAVEAANGLPPTPRAVAAPPAQQRSGPTEALGPITVPSRSAGGALIGAPAAAAVGTARTLQPVLSRGVDFASSAQVITRAEIDASGQTLLSELVRDLAANTHGSFRQSSGSSAQSQATVNLRGVGATNSLVLINGERVAGSPTFGGGSAFNLNTIPMAAVERIEVLAEGASALYGDDAIGGVVNIVLAEKIDGFTLSAGVAEPSRGGGEEQSFSISGGFSGERGQLSFALDHAEQDIIFNGDRDYSAIGLSSFGFPASFFASGPNGESLGTFPDPRCPAQLGDSEEFPDSQILGGRCRYNYAGVSANEASLERTSLYVNSDYDITGSVKAFARAVLTRTESFGRYAPTPQVGGSPFLPTMSANNPNNPTNPANPTNVNGDDLTAFQQINGLTGPFDLSIFYRNVPAGFRDSFVDDELIDVVGGITAESDLLGGVGLSIVAQHSEQTSFDESTGLADRTALQAAIDDGSYDIFAVNGPTDPAVAASIARTGTRDSSVRRDAVRAQVALNAIRTGNMSLPLTFGVQTADESFSQDYDALSNAGALDGTAGGQDISGSRRVTSVYGSATLNMGTRGQLSAHARTDDYDVIGAVSSQKISGAFAVAPGTTLHASYSNGYSAPSFTQVNAGRTISFNNAIDVTRCAAAIPAAVNPDGSINAAAIPAGTPPNNPCIGTQYQNVVGGNPDLDVATAESWTAGVSITGDDGLELAVSGYYLEIEDQVGTIPLQATLANEFVNGGSALVERNADGTINQILGNNQNVAATRTYGVTLDAVAGAYRSGIGPGARLSANYIAKLDRQTVPGGDFQAPAGAFQPRVRANLDMLWRFNEAVRLNLNGNYIAAASFPDQTASLGDWLTWDTQLEVVFPWDGALAVGARNLFDVDPPTDPSLGNPFYREALHNPYGITPYVRYTQEL